MASGINSFEKNVNHITLVCVMNRKLNAQMIIGCLSIDGATVCIRNYAPFANLNAFKSELVNNIFS